MIQRDGALSSLWQATTTTNDYQPERIFPGTKTFDVAIVGGGITGVTTALLLQEAGLKCIILEANTLCFGTTGGTTAHLNTVLDTPYPTIIKNFGQEKAGLVARAVEDAIALVRENCHKYNIDAGFEPQTAYIFSQTEEQTKELEDIRQTSAELGIGIAYSDTIPVPIEMQKAVSIEGQAKFHPTRYVMGLAKAFQERGGIIVEQCRVTDVENIEPILAHTSRGDLQCNHLIYATHIPPGINVLDTRVAPYRSYAIAVTLNEHYPEGLIYDMYDPYRYYRTQIVDGKPFLIAGGEDHKTGHEENAHACFLRLESYVRKHFAVDEVVYRWSSQYFEPVDGVPYIGHLPGEPGNILVATGFSGNGMVYSGVAALIFRSLLQKNPIGYAEVFDPNRLKPVAGFSNFIRENVDVAKKWIGKWLPGDKLETLADIAPGEGHVVKFEGETIALYKTEDGKLMALAPTCPHMGCHVAWNNSEKSWDCPCHGARYSIDGTVLTGPAAHDLHKIDLKHLVEK